MERIAQPPKEWLAKRYKVVWRVLTISNLALGAYLFSKARKKDTTDSKAGVKIPPSLVEPGTTLIPMERTFSSPIVEPMKCIPKDQQLELFKWILEEEKGETLGPEEKKRIDEEKAILKQFILAESIPRI